MQLKFIRQGSPRLILIFAGWAMDHHPFACLFRPGYDVAVAWDYTDISMDYSLLSDYEEICVVAWSLGVRAACSGVLAPVYDRVTLRLAVNGTVTPIDDTAGIPRALFEASRSNLSENSLERFYRRVAGSASLFRRFMEVRPRRALPDLAEELDVFLCEKLPGCDPTFRWDRAVISDGDAIFPVANQHTAWKDTAVDVILGAHLPDFQSLLNTYIIDKDRTAVRFQNEIGGYEDAAAAQKTIAHELMELAARHKVLPVDGAVLEIGSGSGLLSRMLAEPGMTGSLELWDLTESPALPCKAKFKRGDAETMMRQAAKNAYDVIISSSTLQWFNSPGRFIENCAHALKRGGFLIFSSFGEDNLKEVADSTGRALPRLSLRDWTARVPDVFSTVYAGEKRITLQFESPRELFGHLRDTGVNSLGTPGICALRNAISTMRPSESGKFSLTYHPVFCILQKRYP